MLRLLSQVHPALPCESTRIGGSSRASLCADLPPGHFVTAWLGELNAADRTLISVSAGQGPILHYLAATQQFDVFEGDTMPLGFDEDLDVPPLTPIRMESGDIFAVISDGVFETMDQTDTPFGTPLVMQIITDHCQSPAAEILAALQNALTNFSNGAPTLDDRTAVIIKCTSAN
jgi:sigma-B regulation protein RsbU (phosphoserine phosphatase)